MPSSDDPNRPGHGQLPPDAEPAQEGATQRQDEKREEDLAFEPVVVKRIDQFRRHPDDVLQMAIREGREQADRSALSLFLSALSAGAILCFSAMAVAVVLVNQDGGYDRLAVAVVYPLGFVLCLMTGTQLFTEHTALAVFPVLDRSRGTLSMLRIWGYVLAGNVVGCALGAGLLALAEDVVDAGMGYRLVAEHMTDFAPGPVFLSSILAGWLMALGGWLVLATPPGGSQIVLIYATTFLIGLGGLHHSIAGAAELLVAGFIGGLQHPAAAAGLWFCMVVGNLAGGALFVAVLNYGHIRKTQAPAQKGGR